MFGQFGDKHARLTFLYVVMASNSEKKRKWFVNFPKRARRTRADSKEFTEDYFMVESITKYAVNNFNKRYIAHGSTELFMASVKSAHRNEPKEQVTSQEDGQSQER